jgi:hypothetical protein
LDNTINTSLIVESSIKYQTLLIVKLLLYFNPSVELKRIFERHIIPDITVWPSSVTSFKVKMSAGRILQFRFVCFGWLSASYLKVFVEGLNSQKEF